MFVCFVYYEMNHLLSVRLCEKKASASLRVSDPGAIPARLSDQGPYQLRN